MPDLTKFELLICAFLHNCVKYCACLYFLKSKDKNNFNIVFGEIDLHRRIIAVFTAFSLAVGCICLRLYTISTGGENTVSSGTHHFTIEIGKIRGEITDCNGEKIVSADYENIVAAKPTYKALSAIENVVDSEVYSSLRERMQSGNAVSVNIGKLEILQNSDAVMLKKYKRYSENQLAAHLIGYLDGDGRGVSGIEKSYDSLLYTDEYLSVKFFADVHGRVLSGTDIEIRNSTLKTAQVQLTLDLGFQKALENALDISDVERGGAVVVEVKTGAIKAMASRPDFDADNISLYLNDDASPLLNRALNAYAVGSVFKVAVAAAALENGIDDFHYECGGSCNVDGVTFSCNKSTAHGELDMTKALECSCNTFFIELAARVGAEKIIETASLFGFGQEIKLAEGISSKAGIFPSAKELSSSGALANFSFGQGEFTATMLQLATMMSAVACKGKYMQPYLIEKVTDSSGKITERKEESYPVSSISEKSAEKLKMMLKSVVENGNAQKARLKNEVSAAGKTSTAQSGVFEENGVEVCNTWFAGFFPIENPKYVVVILKEGGASGATDCAPVFKRIADKIYDLEKIF